MYQLFFLEIEMHYQVIEMNVLILVLYPVNLAYQSKNYQYLQMIHSTE